MGEPVKGTVTSLSSLFPADEAQKALQRVHDTIGERQKELDKLNGFVADNKNLINLVQRLPDKLHHDVMVSYCAYSLYTMNVLDVYKIVVIFRFRLERRHFFLVDWYIPMNFW